MKRSKDDVDYGRGMKSAHCGVCRFFEHPHWCQKVAGRISPEGWCRLFVREQEKDTAA